MGHIELIRNAIKIKDINQLTKLISEITLEEKTKGNYLNLDILYDALRSKDNEIFKLIIDNTSDEVINTRDCLNHTILYFALEVKEFEMCKLLIPRMTNESIEARSHFLKKSVLHQAILWGQEEIIKLIINIASNNIINSIDATNQTPLHYAAEKEMFEICKLLIPRMTNESIEIQEARFGQIALHLSIIHGHTQISKAIIKAFPSSINIVSKDNFTPLDNATSICLIEKNPKAWKIVKTLIEYGGNFNQPLNDNLKYCAVIMEIIDQILEQKQFDNKILISPEPTEILVNRFKFKLYEKFSSSTNKEFSNFKLYMQSLEGKIVGDFYNKLIASLDKIKTVDGSVDLLDMNEAQLISIFETKEGAPMSTATYKLLFNNKDKFKKAQLEEITPETRKLNFYEANGKEYTKIGSYLLKLLNNPKDLEQKLAAHPEGWLFIKNIQNILLPLEISKKMDKFCKNIIFEEEQESIATTKIQLENNDVTISKSNEHNEENYSESNINHFNEDTNNVLITKLLFNNKDKFKKAQLEEITPETRKLNFYEANGKEYTKIGSYLLKLLNNPKDLEQKLAAHPEGWLFIKNIQNILLPLEISKKMDKFCKNIIFEEEQESIATTKIQLENNDVTISKSNEHNEENYSESNINHFNEDTNNVLITFTGQITEEQNNSI